MHRLALVAQARAVLALDADAAWLANAVGTPALWLDGSSVMPYFGGAPCLPLTPSDWCAASQGTSSDAARSGPQAPVSLAPETITQALRLLLAGRWTVQDNGQWYQAWRDGAGVAYVERMLRPRHRSCHLKSAVGRKKRHARE